MMTKSQSLRRLVRALRTEAEERARAFSLQKHLSKERSGAKWGEVGNENNQRRQLTGSKGELYLFDNMDDFLDLVGTWWHVKGLGMCNQVRLCIPGFKPFGMHLQDGALTKATRVHCGFTAVD